MPKKTNDDFETFNELHERYEPLRPELHDYLQQTSVGYFIRHPFCNEEVHDLDRCALIHHLIDRQEAKADACFESGDWEGYLGCVDINLQPEWFAKDAYLFPDDRYWMTLSRVYDNLMLKHRHKALFDELFRSPRPGRENLMSPDEQRVFTHLPEVLTVYRGYDDELYWEEAAEGISWTLDRRSAIWFANYRSESPFVVSGIVPKAEVWACLTGGEVQLPAEKVVRRRFRPAFSKKARRQAYPDFIRGSFDVTKLFVA